MSKGKGKGKRRRGSGGHPARQSRLRVIEGGAPLESRPEYRAHMQAWREAGCPLPGS